jgi:hypothetical protein
MRQAAADGVKAEVVADLAASMALGSPLDRKTQIEPKFAELGKSLLAAEKAVITGGNFQKLFNRLPKANTEWDFVRNLSYRARTIARNSTKEVQARQAYEKQFKVNMVTLSKSTKQADVLKVSEAWSVIRVLSKSSLLESLNGRTAIAPCWTEKSCKERMASSNITEALCKELDGKSWGNGGNQTTCKDL